MRRSAVCALLETLKLIAADKRRKYLFQSASADSHIFVHSRIRHGEASSLQAVNPTAETFFWEWHLCRGPMSLSHSCIFVKSENVFGQSLHVNAVVGIE